MVHHCPNLTFRRHGAALVLRSEELDHDIFVCGLGHIVGNVEGTVYGGTDVDGLATPIHHRPAGLEVVIIRELALLFHHVAVDTGGCGSAVPRLVLVRTASGQPFILGVVKDACALRERAGRGDGTVDTTQQHLETRVSRIVGLTCRVLSQHFLDFFAAIEAFAPGRPDDNTRCDCEHAQGKHERRKSV